MEYENMIIKDEFFRYARIEDIYCLQLIINEFGTLSDFSEEFELDFVICKYNDVLEFNHISKVKNLNGILKDGLKAGTGDFGYGIYIIPSDDEIANDNLKTYVSEMFDYNEKNILMIKGTYSGEYYKCIYGEGKEGYCIIESNNIPILDYKIIKIEDYLLT